MLCPQWIRGKTRENSSDVLQTLSFQLVKASVRIWAQDAAVTAVRWVPTVSDDAGEGWGKAISLSISPSKRCVHAAVEKGQYAHTIQVHYLHDSEIQMQKIIRH